MIIRINEQTELTFAWIGPNDEASESIFSLISKAIQTLVSLTPTTFHQIDNARGQTSLKSETRVTESAGACGEFKLKSARPFSNGFRANSVQLSTKRIGAYPWQVRRLPFAGGSSFIVATQLLEEMVDRAESDPTILCTNHV